MRHRRLRLRFVPTINQFAAEFFIRPGSLHLIENELVVLLDRLNDLSQPAHKLASVLSFKSPPLISDFYFSFLILRFPDYRPKLNRTIDPRQDHDAVLQPCRSVAGRAG